MPTVSASTVIQTITVPSPKTVRPSASPVLCISMNGAEVPQVSYSPVTITRWQPEERTY